MKDIEIEQSESYTGESYLFQIKVGNELVSQYADSDFDNFMKISSYLENEYRNKIRKEFSMTTFKRMRYY